MKNFSKWIFLNRTSVGCECNFFRLFKASRWFFLLNTTKYLFQFLNEYLFVAWLPKN